jgi:hypothetical protein
MNHPTEDELVLHHYGEGESARPEAIPSHLGVCADCRGRLEVLAAELAQFDRLPIPARGDSYGRELWQRLRPRLPNAAPTRPPVFGWRPWVLSASLAALLAAAFLAGRFWHGTPAAPSPSIATTADARERILLAEVADHLDRSQIALLEFLHADAASGPDAERERHFAEDLVSSSRIYRQTAASAGESELASVLDGLERTLLEIAHSTTPEAREALRRRLDSEGTLFKLRILRSQLGRREKAAAPHPPQSVRS